MGKSFYVAAQFSCSGVGTLGSLIIHNVFTFYKAIKKDVKA